jgi:hypothetical protein
MKRHRLTFTTATTDEMLRDLGVKHIQSVAAGGVLHSNEYRAKELYDSIVTIHRAREAVRRSNRRKSR